MTIQEDIILFLSILFGCLVFGLLILKKSLHNHNIRLQESFDNFKIETKKEFERIRFTEKPICSVGTKYGKDIIVTKVKYDEYPYLNIHQSQSNRLLNMGYDYEILNLKTKQISVFNGNTEFSRFLKWNNLINNEGKN